MADIKIIVGLFITLIVGVVLIQAIADDVWEATNPVVASFENVSIEAGRTSDGSIYPNVTFTLANDDVISIDGVSLSNGTTLTLNTHYAINSTIGEGYDAPVVSILNSSLTGESVRNINYTSWNYTHAGNAYVQGGGTSRTLLTLVILFFALAILTMAFLALRNSEIMDSFRR